jgi:predicted ATPase/class 3 adenylate cyclase
MTDAGTSRSPRHAGIVRSSSGTQTFLFTDIEGSTRLVQQLGDGFPQLLLDQRVVLLSAVERGGGREVGDRGDGSFIVFDSALDAVAAAAAAQRALAEHTWPAGVRMRVRMGLHSGESEIVDEAGDPERTGVYAGFDVFRTARIAAAGHGGQVLLSQTTRQLVERDLPEGVELRDLGSHALKDLDRPEQLWQLVVPGLPTEFPPLRSVSARPGNLPLDPGQLLGREHEVETVHGMLGRDEVRLVTLVGPGGSGKTRLAMEVARSLAAEYRDGAYFVPLGAVRNRDEVLPRIAESLALREQGGGTVADALAAWCRDRRLLLVLDDFERVVDAGGAVAGLLATCPGLKVLVTSRIVLRVKGEHEFAVPPLPVPDRTARSSLEDLARVPAVALFVQRARAVRPDFAVTDDNAAAVARICRDLDGLPLAIELAAARVKLLPPQAMVARLERRLDLLKGGAKDLPERQRTLRDAIDWSYELLGPAERAIFRRLASFAGGCTLEAAEALCMGADADALDSIAALIDNSLVHMTDGPDGEPRYGLLSTIREYGLERLRAEGEEDRVRAGHAEYFLALAEEAEPELTKAGQATWLRRLEVEHDNLRAALDWLESSGDHASALRLGAALWRFWVARAPLREAVDRLTRVLDLPGAQEPTDIRARTLHGAATMLVSRGDIGTARSMFEAALEIRRALDDRRGVADSLNGLSWLEVIQGAPDRVDAYAADALTLARDLGDARAEALALNNMSFAASQRSDFEAARSLMTEALELRRRAGDRRGEAYARVNLAGIDAAQGRLESARALVDEGAAVLRDLGDRMTGAWALLTSARIHRARGDGDAAVDALQQAIETWQLGGNHDVLAWTLAELAAVELDVGTLEAAERTSEQALAMARVTGSRLVLANVLPAAATVARAAGDTGRATDLLRESLDIAAETGDRVLAARAREGLARLELDAGHAAAAADLVAGADALRSEVGAPRSTVEERGLEGVASPGLGASGAS